MKINQKSTRWLYWFGTVYLMANVIILMVLCILFVQSDVPDSLMSILAVLTIPGAGMISGYWLRSATLSWWKIIIIAASFLIWLSIIFTSVFISPKLEKLKHDKYTENLKKRTGKPESGKIFLALYNDNIKAVFQLLDAGVDIGIKNDTGQTLLHVARHPDVVRRLIQAGADVNAVDADGYPSIFNKEIDSLKILVAAGANIHMKSLKGRNTALTWFSYSGYIEGVQYLVSKGADINHVNSDGNTALDIAQRFGHTELEAYLRSAGAKSEKQFFSK